MASLSNLLQTKQALAQIDEENLDTGQIFVFYPGRFNGNFRCNFCWNAPGNGTAVIEVWGASGSASMMCCCGFGLPGNPGAYARKTITVSTGDRVFGNTGISCGNASQINFRGCSCNTGITVCAGGTCSCICAEGGSAGCSLCVDGGSVYCCFGAQGFCTANTGVGCGIICNFGSGYMTPLAYGGDVNCAGQFSCIEFRHCNPSCWCCHTQYIKTSANVFGECPTTIAVNHDTNQQSSGFAINGFFQGLAGASASPTMGSHYRYCYSSTNYCGCYEYQGCSVMVPTGVPAPGSTPCSSVRDHGLRGGHGSVKIRFISSE